MQLKTNFCFLFLQIKSSEPTGMNFFKRFLKTIDLKKINLVQKFALQTLAVEI